MSISRRFLQPINLVNSGSDPVSASSGDLYFNSASSTIRYFDGTEWKNVGDGASAAGVTISETPPANPVEGQGWFKSSTSELFFWDGTFWVEATSIVDNYLLFTVSASAPSSPLEGAGWFNNVEGEFYIYDGTYWQEVVRTVQAGVMSLVGTSGQINVSASTGAVTASLANSGVSASTYGSSSQIPILVVDATGRITSASVAGVEGLPSQTGNEGKYLTTDGTTASWGEVEQGGGSIQTDVALSNSWWLGV